MSTAALAISLSAPSPALAVSEHSLLRSRQLWATIDVCSPPDQPGWIGIRGSMPGDGRAHDTMYMRFRLQQLNPARSSWVDVAKGATRDFVAVGNGKSSRESGFSFDLMPPVKGKPVFTLRGVVSFQWRDGTTVVASTSRPTTTGHKGVVGADPAGFSAASCLLG
jgi:hypothetical protein